MKSTSEYPASAVAPNATPATTAALPPKRRRPRAPTNAATYSASRSSSRSDALESIDQKAERPVHTERARSAPPNHRALRGIHRTPSMTKAEAASSPKPAVAHGHEPALDPPPAAPSATRDTATTTAVANRRSRANVPVGARSREGASEAAELLTHLG